MTNRSERKEWFESTAVDRSPLPMLFIGDSQTDLLGQEMRVSFVLGNYLATIILCASIIEQMLYRQLEQTLRQSRGAGWPLGVVLNQSTRTGIIKDQHVEDFDELGDISNLRNDIVHYRGFSDESQFDQERWELSKERLENATDGELPNSLWDDDRQIAKRYAKRMIRATFDIQSRCEENMREFWDHEGPLRQGIDTIKSGSQMICPNCGTNFEDVKLDYSVEWDGEEIVSEFAKCVNCGGNAISAFHN